METVIVFVLTVAVASYVAWPLIVSRASTDIANGSPSDGPNRWERQKREAYAAIKEAEFDHQMGKLTDVDFGMLQHKYREQALVAIAAMATDRPSTSHAGTAGRPPSRIAYCPSCGRSVPPRANFCSSCGTGLKARLKEVAA